MQSLLLYLRSFSSSRNGKEKLQRGIYGFNHEYLLFRRPYYFVLHARDFKTLFSQKFSDFQLCDIIFFLNIICSFDALWSYRNPILNNSSLSEDVAGNDFIYILRSELRNNTEAVQWAKSEGYDCDYGHLDWLRLNGWPCSWRLPLLKLRLRSSFPLCIFICFRACSFYKGSRAWRSRWKTRRRWKERRNRHFVGLQADSKRPKSFVLLPQHLASKPVVHLYWTNLGYLPGTSL